MNMPASRDPVVRLVEEFEARAVAVLGLPVSDIRNRDQLRRDLLTALTEEKRRQRLIELMTRAGERAQRADEELFGIRDGSD